MKKVLLAGCALAALAVGPSLAADMPVKARPLPVAYSWTGCYVGSFIGGKWGESAHTSTGFTGVTGQPTYAVGQNITGRDIEIAGYLSGGDIGCNYQTGNFVIGVEVDGAWAKVTGDRVDVGSNDIFSSVKESWIVTARARLGVTFAQGKGLLYVTGGGAWAGVKVGSYSAPVTPVELTERQTMSGWTIGGGLEWQLIGPLTAKAEYLYIDLGTDRFFAATPGYPYFERDVSIRQHVAKVGINYRFTP